MDFGPLQNITPSNLRDFFNCEVTFVTPYKCNFCSFTTYFLISLHNHIKNVHYGFKQPPCIFEYYKCTKCKYGSFSYMIFSRHTPVCPRNKTRPEFTKIRLDNRNWFKCGSCPYKSKQVSGVKAHIIARHTPYEKTNWFLCNSCLHRSKTKGDLKKHIQRIHTREGLDESKKFQCDQCPFKTKRKAYLRKHIIMIHTICDKKETKSKVILACTKCKYTTQRSDNLKTHIKEQHTAPQKIKWFDCDQCDYKAKRRNRLKEHKLMKHTDLEKIQWFKCEHCDYKGKLKANLKAHIFTKHVDLDF